MRKLITTVLLLPLFYSSAWADISLLRDQLLAADPTTVSNALKEAEGLNPKDRRLLVISLTIAMHNNPTSAPAAATALAGLGKEAEEAIPELVSALRFDDPAIALAVGGSLIKIGPASISPLTRMLDDGNFVVRQRAAAILGAFGPEAKRAIPDLVPLLQDPQTAPAAEGALLKIGESAVPALADASHKGGPADRQTVVRFIGRFGASASPALVQALRKDDSAGVRASAANALGTIRPVGPSVVPALIDALKDPDDSTRNAAVTAIMQIGPEAKAALGSMIAMSYRDSEALVRQSSTRAVQTIGRASKASIPGLLDNTQAVDSTIRRDTLVALAQAEISPEELTPLLAIVLKDPDTTVKLPTVQAAGELVKTYAGAISLLRTAAFDNDKKTRPVAIDALGGAASNPQAAALVLEDVMKDPDPGVRNQCIQALARLGPAGVPALLRELHDSYTVLADNALSAILSIGTDAIPELEKAKTGNDAVIQKRAAELIAHIQSNPSKRSRKN